MKGIDKTKEQLLIEIDQLKKKVVDLENSKPELIDNEEKYRLIFEGANDGIVYADKNTTILNINPAFTEITGISKENVIGKTGFELARKFVNARQLPNILSIIKSAFTKKNIKPFELNFDNRVLEISHRRENNGRTVGIIRDITKRRNAEVALKDSEERLKIIFDNAPYAIFLGGIDGTILDGNRAAEEILGYKTKDVKGSNIFKTEFTDISNIPKITKALARSALGLKTGPEVYIANRKDGRQVFVEISTYPVKIKNKSIVLGIAQDITNRLQTENALRESEEKYRSLFDQSADAILIIEGNHFVDCNHAAIKLIGCESKKEFLNTHPSQLSPEFQANGMNSFEAADNMMSMAHKNGSHRFEWLHKRKDGSIFPVEVSLTAVPMGKEKFLHVIWRDITDRKEAEKALLKSEQQYRSFFEKDISGVFLSTPEGKILDFNPAFKKMFGYSSKEIREMNTTQLYPRPKDRKEFLKRLSENKILINLELDLVKKDGQIIHCIENVVGEFDNAGKLIQFQGYLVDITERKIAEEELKNSEKTFKVIFDAAPYSIFLKNKKGIILDGNKEAEHLIGQKKEEVIGKNISTLNFSMKTDKLKLGKTLAKVLMGRKTGPDEFLLERPDGTQRLVESSTFPVKIKNRSLVLGFANDITDRKLFEDALSEQALYNQQILQTTMDAFILADTDGKIIEVNDSYVEMVGYSQDELLSMNIWDLEVQIPLEEANQRIEKMLRDEKGQFETKHKCKDGSIIDLEVSISVLQQKEKPMVASFIRDITERKNAEKAIKESEYLLRESQKVSKLGSYILDFLTGQWESSEIMLDIFGIDKKFDSNIEGWLNIIHPDDIEMMKNYFEVDILTNHEPFNKEYRIIKMNDKKEIWVHGLGQLEFDQNGAPAKMIGTIQDITERKLIDVALKESEAKYRSLIEHSNDAIYLLYNNKFEMINHKFSELFGYTLDDLNKPGFGYADLIAPISMDLFIDRQKKYLDGDLLDNKYEITLLTKDGNELEVEISDSFLDYKDSIANQGYIRDITARKKRQEILMNAIIKVQEDEKYKFGKELHDGLGQVLISASMYLESLKKIKDKLDDSKRKDIEQAQRLNKQAINDARRISHGLMITGIDEHGILHLIKQLCYNSGGPEITFSFSHENIDEEKISSDYKVHLYRIVQELSTNILKHAKATKSQIKLSSEDDYYLKLLVSDNGKGFDINNVVFGAGLRNIDQRISIMKGSKEIRTEKGKGTTIIISIPLH